MTVASVAWRIMGRSMFFWIGAVFAVVGTVFLGAGLGDARQAFELRENGISAVATVVSRKIEAATGRDHPTTEYVLGYTYQPPGQQLLAGLAVVPVEQWEATREGAPLPIHYLPERPYESRLANDAGWGVAPGFIPLGTLFAAIGLALVTARVRRLRLVLQLTRDGAKTEGTLTRVGPSSVWINNVRQWRLEYEFADAAGQRRTGTTDTMPPQVARRWRRGDRGPVRYDAADPRRSIWANLESQPTTTGCARE